jgi:hypothetical protein
MNDSLELNFMNEEHSETDLLSMDNNLYTDYLLKIKSNEANQSTNSSINNIFNSNEINSYSPSIENIQKIFITPNEDNDTIEKMLNILSPKLKSTVESKNESKSKTNYTNNKKIKCGRKTLENTKTENIHDKFKGDNIIRKIKVHIIQEKIISIINTSLKSKKTGKKKLLKLYQKDLTSLKKDKNLELMNTTLKDIYTKNKIGEKYLDNKGKYNEKLINEIYSNDEYIELQKLLNLTFIEFYNIYTHKLSKKDLDENLIQKMKNISFLNSNNFQGIEVYINNLKEKNKKKGMSDDENDNYINTFKYYCRIYKEWFESKVGRNEKD